MCILPSITTTALFCEFLFYLLRLPYFPSFVTQARFRSRRLRYNAPTPRPFGASQAGRTRPLVYRLFLFRNIASHCGFYQSFGKNAHQKVSQFSNSLFMTGKHMAAAIMGTPISDPLFIVIHSRDQCQAMGCTPRDCQCKYTTQRFYRLRTHNLLPPVYHLQQILFVSLFDREP